MKKILFIIPVMALCMACNNDPQEKPFGKTFSYSGTYIVNKNVEMEWLKDNFDKIKFKDDDNDDKNVARYEYWKAHETDVINLENQSTYDDLMTTMENKNLEIANDNCTIGAVFSFEKMKNDLSHCHYENWKFHEGKPSVLNQTAELDLSIDKIDKSSFTLKGTGQLKDQYGETKPVELAFSILGWQNNKIEYILFNIGDNEGGFKNDFRYIFPMKDGSPDHIINCYVNLLPA